MTAGPNEASRAGAKPEAAQADGDVRIAVVTASRGRPEALEAKAASLRAQTLDPGRFEWSLWLNETPEETERVRERLLAGAPPFAVHVAGGVDHPVGRARNLAARAASAPLLLLSDDDCRHDPGALAAHVAFHDRVPGAVGIGPLRLPGELRRGRRREPFERPASAFGRAHWINATGANTSLARDAFRAVGGYDPSWYGYGGEDPELALRLRARGMTFRHVPGGGAEHDGRVWDDAEKAYLAGRAHVRVARRHRGAQAGWWLGVHPVLLALKRPLLNGPWSGLLDPGVLAYERAYARGARDARRETADDALAHREETP